MHVKKSQEQEISESLESNLGLKRNILLRSIRTKEMMQNLIEHMNMPNMLNQFTKNSLYFVKIYLIKEFLVKKSKDRLMSLLKNLEKHIRIFRIKLFGF